MTEYQFHWRPSAHVPAMMPSVTLDAESSGCDVAAPLAHVDLTESGGARHVLLVEEVLDWLKEPTQSAFVQHEGLAALLQ